jgi:putative drug exporter of the RND superfamily
VLLPAAIVLLGRFNWWIPRRLGRMLPRIHFGGSQPRPPAVGGVRHRPN